MAKASLTSKSSLGWRSCSAAINRSVSFSGLDDTSRFRHLHGQPVGRRAQCAVCCRGMLGGVTFVMGGTLAGPPVATSFSRHQGYLLTGASHGRVRAEARGAITPVHTARKYFVTVTSHARGASIQLRRPLKGHFILGKHNVILPTNTKQSGCIGNGISSGRRTLTAGTTDYARSHGHGSSSPER